MLDVMGIDKTLTAAAWEAAATVSALQGTADGHRAAFSRTTELKALDWRIVNAT